MAYRFTNTFNNLLIGTELEKFLQELTWEYEGEPIVFKSDGHLEYKGKEHSYAIQDTGVYSMHRLLDRRYRNMLNYVGWLGISIDFKVGMGEIIKHCPVIRDGEYYLYALTRKNRGFVAEGYDPLVKPVVEPATVSPCSICFEETANYAAVPCGHKCGCEECLKNVMEKGNGCCPICRTKMDCFIRVYDTQTPSYATAVVAKPTVTPVPSTTVLDINDVFAFPPLQRPEFQVNINSILNVYHSGGQKSVYTLRSFLDQFNANYRNIVTWYLPNGDEQHGRVSDIYNQLYMAVINAFPTFKTKFDTQPTTTLITHRPVKPEPVTTPRPVKPEPVTTPQPVTKPQPVKKGLNAHAVNWTPLYNK